MSFADFPEQEQVVRLLQRSLDRKRLAHAYLFSGADLAGLEAMARTLAKALNCQEQPGEVETALPHDSCDRCLSCRKIDNAIHPDVLWIRPESKSRVITIDQIRELMRTIHLKPTEAQFKVAVIVAADRLNVQAANAFLKTLEEPPDRSILILLTIDSQRILETVLSRCLRLSFAGESGHIFDPAQMAWLAAFSETAAAESSGLLGRYRLLGALLSQLARRKAHIEEALTARSPLERYEDADAKLREKWEEELIAAIEAEYRRQRAELLLGLLWWLRDVWLRTQTSGKHFFRFPELETSTAAVAGRLSTTAALDNLNVLDQTHRLLNSNVQEALALEVGLLKLKL